MGFNLFTKPVDVYSRPKQYDTSKSVEENLAQSNTPTAEEISSAYRTPTAQLQMQQGQVQQPVTTPADTVNAQTKPITNMDELAQAMGYTSPQEEERLRKASLTNQRIMAVGDALRHIGNLYYTINGATPQKYNSPVLEEEQRYLRGKAMRDKANHTYLTYKQAKDKQDQQAKQWEAQFNLNVANAASQDAYRREQARIAGERAANDKENKDKIYALNVRKADDAKYDAEERRKETRRYNNARISQGNQRLNIAKQKLEWQKAGGGNGSKVPPLDTPDGPIQPSGANYGNQLLQMWSYARDRGLVSESDVQRQLAEAGFGKETPDNVKRQQVLSLLRTNRTLGKYAKERLNWTFSNGGTPSTDWSEYEEDNWNEYEED